MAGIKLNYKGLESAFITSIIGVTGNQISLTPWDEYSRLSTQEMGVKRHSIVVIISRERYQSLLKWKWFDGRMYVHLLTVMNNVSSLHSSNMHIKASLICAHSSAIASPAASATSSPICTMAFMTTARSLENFKVALNLLFSICETMTLFTHSRRLPSSMEVNGAEPPDPHKACWFFWYSWECSINCTSVLRSFFSTACSSIDWSVGSDCNTRAKITGSSAHLDSQNHKRWGRKHSELSRYKDWY